MTATMTEAPARIKTEAEIKMDLIKWIMSSSLEELQPLIDLQEVYPDIEDFVSYEEYNGPTFYEGDLDEGYAAMYADEEREKEAMAWIEGTIQLEEE